jgi:cell division protein FtsB
MEQLKLLGRRLFLMGGLVLILLLVMDFNNRMADLARLRAQYTREHEQYARMESTAVVLATRIANASSDEAIEDAIREDGRWVRPGDYIVVPLTPVGYEPPPEQPEADEVQPVSYWELWMALFFGAP